MISETVVEILSYGVIGLGFLLALLSYRLLAREQHRDSPRKNILHSILIFMVFSIILCLVGLWGTAIEKSGNTNSFTNTADEDDFSTYFSKLRQRYAHASKPLQFQYGKLEELDKATLTVNIPAGTTVRYLAAVSDKTEANFGYWANYPDGGGVDFTESGGKHFQTGYISSKNDLPAELGLFIEMELGDSDYAIETYFSSQKVYENKNEIMEN